jgi:hypothetical protein
MARIHAANASRPMIFPSERRSENNPVATPLTSVTTPSRTVV